MLNLIALQLDREGIKGREDGERGRGEAIIRRRRLFYVFPSEGGDNSMDGYYSRKYSTLKSEMSSQYMMV